MTTGWMHVWSGAFLHHLPSKVMPIHPKDSLDDHQARTRAVEHRLLVEALRGLVAGD